MLLKGLSGSKGTPGNAGFSAGMMAVTSVWRCRAWEYIVNVKVAIAFSFPPTRRVGAQFYWYVVKSLSMKPALKGMWI